MRKMGKGGTTVLEVKAREARALPLGLPHHSASCRPLNSLGTASVHKKTLTKAPLHTFLSGQKLPLVLVSSSHACLS